MSYGFPVLAILMSIAASCSCQRLRMDVGVGSAVDPPLAIDGEEVETRRAVEVEADSVRSRGAAEERLTR